MTVELARYEIILPLKFNDGAPVDVALHDKTFREIAHFAGAGSFESQEIRGVWYNGEHPQEELNVRLFVDVPDTQDNLDWFARYKATLKSRFEQLDIWMTKHPIEFVK